MVKAALVLMLNKVHPAHLLAAVTLLIIMIGSLIDRHTQAKTRRWHQSAEVVRASFSICLHSPSLVVASSGTGTDTLL